MNTHDKYELPEPKFPGTNAEIFHAMPDLYTAEQMIAAIEADRKCRGEPVIQFRKEYCADWYDGYPDHSDGGGPYETRTLYTAPQPAENSVNLEVAIQAISALHSNDTDWDTSYWNQAVGRCVSELNKLSSQQPAETVFTTPDCPRCGCVQDGQCLCSPSRPSAEPVLFQYREHLVGSNRRYGWSDCSKEHYEECLRKPILDGWEREVRALGVINQPGNTK